MERSRRAAESGSKGDEATVANWTGRMGAIQSGRKVSRVNGAHHPAYPDSGEVERDSWRRERTRTRPRPRRPLWKKPKEQSKDRVDRNGRNTKARRARTSWDNKRARNNPQEKDRQQWEKTRQGQQSRSREAECETRNHLIPTKPSERNSTAAHHHQTGNRPESTDQPR